MGHENPTITDCVRQSGGAYLIGDANAPEVVLNFAKKHEVDIVFVNADEPLANGAVDVLLENNIKAVGATRMPPELSGINLFNGNDARNLPAVYALLSGRFPTRRVARSRSNIYK